jgi:hypothetical protein
MARKRPTSAARATPEPPGNPYTLLSVASPAYFNPAYRGRGTAMHSLLPNLRRTDPAPDWICLLGERRFGKTSALRFLHETVKGRANLHAAFIDLLTIRPRNPEGFYAGVSRALVRVAALPAERPLRGFDDLEEFLYRLREDGQRLLLFIDEFDLVAGERQFPQSFFDELRGAGQHLPLTLVLASAVPLLQVAHGGAFGSPFFNVFLAEQLRPLSDEEARALVLSPPGGPAGLEAVADEILALAGRHPYLLQLACHEACRLRDAAGQSDVVALRLAFCSKTQQHFQSVWEHLDEQDRQALGELAQGGRSPSATLSRLEERGFVEAGSLDVGGRGFTEFVRSRYPALPARARGPHTSGLQAPLTRPPLSLLDTDPDAPELRLALVVGVNRYRHQQSGPYRLPPLGYAERDADALAAFLETDLRFMVRRLTGERATLDELLRAFHWLEGTTRASPHPQSRFVFHFSGHGQLGIDNEENAYLMLHDSDPADPAGTGLDTERLVYELLPRVQVPHALVLLDACHSGLAAGVKDVMVTPARANPGPENRQLANVVQQLFSGLRGRMILAACGGAAQAHEDPQLGHGIFTSCVLRHWRDRDGVSSSGVITFGSLVDYVGSAMPLCHPHVPLPVYSGVGLGGTLVLRSGG